MDNRKSSDDRSKEQRRSEAAERIRVAYASLYRLPPSHQPKNKDSVVQHAQKRGDIWVVLSAAVVSLIIGIAVLWMAIAGIRFMWDHSPF